jgi:hypothetical protein
MNRTAALTWNWYDDLLARAGGRRDYILKIPRQGIVREWKGCVNPGEDENECAALL